ncbi:hypothetical protein [Alkalihalobacillus sp. AL-G]|uniref:hypothetical protein n=1 Tax=Alkalihalobacillus sp. AL-G TaxID=2926399 RepID=UPI00272CD640|nr:hypothetical protein [Alkalihalobacillus sp. AL-G]WLD94239.1 hypothetical protein MOJ78_04930 [Alkalihalobacillus sp. AL-G]
MVKKNSEASYVDQSNQKNIRAMTPEEIEQFHQKTYEKYIRQFARERRQIGNK